MITKKLIVSGNLDLETDKQRCPFSLDLLLQSLNVTESDVKCITWAQKLNGQIINLYIEFK